MKLDISKLENMQSLVDVSALVASGTIRLTTSKKEYADLTLSDGDRTINAKIWNIPKGYEIPTGVVKFSGSVTSWNNTLQITISGSLAPSDVPMSEFEKWTPYDMVKLTDMLFEYISKIRNDELRLLVKTIFEAVQDDFCMLPAAKSVHHNYKGGLLEHSVCVCDIAVSMAQRSMEPYNMDYIIAGALLHDIGKIVCYKFVDGIPTSTPIDLMVGHIVEGIRIVSQYAAGLVISTDMLSILLHIIASHHEQLEWGSPVTPACTEAYIVAYADNFNAKSTIIRDLAVDKKQSMLTEKAYFLGNHQMLSREFVDNSLA